MIAPDRLAKLIELGPDMGMTGIDYIVVKENQTEIDVHFHVEPSQAFMEGPGGQLTAGNISIIPTDEGNDSITVPDDGIAWVDHTLRITLPVYGGFGLYRLKLDHPDVDGYFNDLRFTFKVHCDSRFDCRAADDICPVDEIIDAPIDYLARDFWSYRRAILEFASLRYPQWQGHLEADQGVMLAEVMAALGDELAFYQDLVSREATLETATHRRSLRHHARLFDYEIHDGLGASTWLQITVEDNGSGNLPRGMSVWSESDSGRVTIFQTGRGIASTSALPALGYPIDAKVNALRSYLWDEDETCLKAGATEIWVEGHVKNSLALYETLPDGTPSRKTIIRTDPDDPSLPARRFLADLIDVTEEEDTLLGHAISRLTFDEDQPFAHDLDLTSLFVCGNIVPATVGKDHDTYFTVGADPGTLGLPDDIAEAMMRTVEREGPDSAVTHILSISDSDTDGIVWLGEKPDTAVPEILLDEVIWNGSEFSSQRTWEWRRSLVGQNASRKDDPHFTLEDGMWRAVVSYRNQTEIFTHSDYVGPSGMSVRFGDNQFGLTPAVNSIFRLRYRTGNGSINNLAADALTHLDAATIAPLEITVTNPLPINTGQEPQTTGRIRQSAPEAWKAITYRAVRPEDYAEAAERLSWVQQAGVRVRWTGSWLSNFVTTDPLAANHLSPERRIELADWLDRFRLSGRDVRVSDPEYANIDLDIRVCVEEDMEGVHIRKRILKSLTGDRETSGFFSPDNFTFGTPLNRSLLEAAIQGVTGVKAVKAILIRRPGVFDWKELENSYLPIRAQELIRMENDPNNPDRGSLKVKVVGGL